VNKTDFDCEVLIVGAGPAGLAAAYRVTQSGSRATVVDDNPDPGGQIWRGEKKKAFFVLQGFYRNLQNLEPVSPGSK